MTTWSRAPLTALDCEISKNKQTNQQTNKPAGGLGCEREPSVGGGAPRQKGQRVPRPRGRKGTSGPQPRAGVQSRSRLHRRKPLAPVQGSQEADGRRLCCHLAAVGHLSLFRPVSPSLSSSPQRRPAVSPSTVLLGGHSGSSRRGAPPFPAAGPSRPLGLFRPRAVSPHARGLGGRCALQTAGAGPGETVSVSGKGEKEGRAGGSTC